jgi:hypothetical protein
MDNFQAIGQLVIKAQDLLDSIKGGAIRQMENAVDALKQTFTADTQAALTDFANKSSAKIAQQDQALRNAVEPIVGKLAIIALSPNQTMQLEGNAVVPKGFYLRAGMTLDKVETISHAPVARTAEQLKMLSDMELDIRAEYPDFDIRKSIHYAKPFNVFRVAWDFPEDTVMNGSHWTFFPGTIPLSTVTSIAAFVKLEEGIANGGLMANSKLGSWEFSSATSSGRFGSYLNAHPIARTRKGSFLIALPVLSTGYLNHPNKLFALPELNNGN